MKKWIEKYNEIKDENDLGGMKWVKKGGGY